MGRKRRNGDTADARDLVEGDGGDGGLRLSPLTAPTQAPTPAAGLVPGLVPGLAQNPLMLAAMARMGAGVPELLAAAGVSAPLAMQPHVANTVDPDVMELCDHFDIEQKHTERLNGIMKNRQDTFEADMLKLWEKLKEARSPAGLLVMKMREMEEGVFVGSCSDKEIGKMAKKYGLDQTAESRLGDVLGRHDATKRAAYLVELEGHLGNSAKPSAQAMMLLKKISDGEPLAKPCSAAPGSYNDRQEIERERAKDKGRCDKDREKDRERRGADRDRRGDDRGPRRSRSRRR